VTADELPPMQGTHGSFVTHTDGENPHLPTSKRRTRRGMTPGRNVQVFAMQRESTRERRTPRTGRSKDPLMADDAKLVPFRTGYVLCFPRDLTL
jgi:hypothetical protein